MFVDDGVSGAEFERRPGFLRLMNALKPKPTFDVLIMSDLDRLGRDGIETPYAIKQLNMAGVAVHSYLEDKEIQMDSPIATLITQVQSFGAAMEREKSAQRTHDTLLRKARAGHVTGGAVFGYANVEIRGADGRRSHVERCINEDEAVVIRRIFQMSADGHGLTAITKTLNAERAPAPRAQRGRPRAWAASSVRDVLLRSLYRGEIVWNQTRKHDSWGRARRSARPGDTWVRVPAPTLQIVPDELWKAAHARFSERQKHFGGGRGRKLDLESRYLLSGFARCAVCGGGLAAHSRSHGGTRAYFYGCTSFWKRGSAVCRNNLVGRMEIVDAEVIATLHDDVCRPAVVEEVVRLALEELAPERRTADREALASELADVRRECARLAEAIGRGGPLEALLARLEDRHARQAALQRELSACEVVSPVLDLQALEGQIRAKLDDWRGLLRRNIAAGRDVLRALLVGPLRFTPVNDGRLRGYRFEGTIAVDRLLAGVVELPTKLASPTGFNPCFGLESEKERDPSEQ